MIFKCPSCRGEVDLPAKGVSGLPQDKNLTDVANKVRLRLAGRRVCQTCHCNEVVSTCFHCDCSWCVDCGQHHKNQVIKDIKKVKNHLNHAKENLFSGNDVDEVRNKDLF